MHAQVIKLTLGDNIRRHADACVGHQADAW